jgi:hypothetical protein
MKVLSLRFGDKAYVDDDDFERLSKYKYALHKGYPRRGNGYSVGPRHYLHHDVLGPAPAPGLEVDHIDRNKLNNTKANLRYVTHLQNLNFTRVPKAAEPNHADREVCAAANV